MECIARATGSCADCRLPLCQTCRHVASDICGQVRKLGGSEVRDLVEFTAPLKLYNALRSCPNVREDLSQLMDHNSDEVSLVCCDSKMRKIAKVQVIFIVGIVRLRLMAESQSCGSSVGQDNVRRSRSLPGRVAMRRGAQDQRT